MKSGNFNETSIELQRKVLDTNQSIGEESYSLHAKSGVQKPGHKRDAAYQDPGAQLPSPQQQW
ncbi:unnamed protein product [Brassica rapa subsp. narinosa]